MCAPDASIRTQDSQHVEIIEITLPFETCENFTNSQWPSTTSISSLLVGLDSHELVIQSLCPAQYEMKRHFEKYRSLPTGKMFSVGSLLFAITIALAACGNDKSTAPNDEVIFSADQKGNIDIYKLRGISGEISRLTTAEGTDHSPAWSPKRDIIGFLTDRNGSNELWLMDWNGESKHQLSGPGKTINAFRWAPNSEVIAVEIAEKRSSWIAVINIETGELTPLTSIEEDARIGGWSPDAQWLLYAIVNSDSDGLRKRNPNGVDEITITSGFHTDPIWSPDGRWIAFSRKSDQGTSDLIITDNNAENVLTVNPDAFDETEFEWAPNSEHIVFSSESSGNAEIYTATPDGKVIKQLTSNRVTDTLPRWNSNGSSILFLSGGNGTFDLYSMDENGDQQKRMTSNSSRIINADW